MKCNNQYFISSDNGIFGLLFPDGYEKIVQLKENEPLTFPAMGTLIPAACSLAMGKPFDEIGEEYNDIYRQVPLRPAIDESVISGSIIYIDSFGNAITNVSKDLFDRVGKGRKFEIYIH